MSDDARLSRRAFFRTSAAAAAGAAALPVLAQETATKPTEQKEDQKPGILPTRKLGRSGIEVTILAQGAAFRTNQRQLYVMHEQGVRYVDTAKAYLRGASERTLAEWFTKSGHRKDYFLVTKDQSLTPDEMIASVNERCEALQTDYIDAFLLHGFGDTDHYHGVDDIKWFTDKEWIAATDKLRKSGKVRLFGFSSHSDPVDVRTALLEGAAKGEWVDMMLISADPTSIRENDAFNKAIDACYKAGIGLVSMKQGRGVETIEKVFPKFADKGISPHTAVLYAMWTDERFASVCSGMKSIEELEENAGACRKFKPLSDADLAAVHDLIREHRRGFCVGCDGSCRRGACTDARLNTVARYVSYAEQDGNVYEARELLRQLPPEALDWSTADLAAASHTCRSHLDYARIIKRAEELLA